MFTRILNSFLSRARSKPLENRRIEIFLEKSIRKLEISNLLEDFFTSVHYSKASSTFLIHAALLKDDFPQILCILPVPTIVRVASNA